MLANRSFAHPAPDGKGENAEFRKKVKRERHRAVIVSSRGEGDKDLPHPFMATGLTLP